jgi:hypothetical protein
MKKFSILSVCVVVMMFVTATAFAATDAIPGSGWWSGEQVQNVGASATDILVTAYDQSSPVNTYTASQNVAAGASFTFIPSHFSGMPEGFQGSAVVSAANPIKAIVNITNKKNGALGVDGGKAAGQYQGLDSSVVATDLYFPLVKGDYYNKTTTFYIQNAGSAAATATATFSMQDGSTLTYATPSIGANQMVAFTVLNAPGFNTSAAAGASSRLGSLKVTSAQPLAGVVVEHFTTETVGTIIQTTRGFTAADFDDKAYAPVIKNNFYNRFTGIQVQNVSAGAIDITITYNGAGKSGATDCVGESYTDTKTGVAAGASWTFVQRVGQSNLPDGCLATATITATGNFVASVNEAYVTAPGTGQRAVTSFAISDNSATTKVSIPLFKDDFYNKRSGLQVQNVGAAAATNIVAEFKCTTEGGASFTATSKALTAASGGSVLFINTNTQDTLFPSPNPFQDHANCGVTITADQPIVAIVNESPTPGGPVDQDNNNYEGFNLVP